MNSETANRLLELNHLFYAEFGHQFSATRHRIQPGVRNIISRLHGDERILDLGCGNGELARVLTQTSFQGSYTGLDFSLPLLSDARSEPGNVSVTFFEADLSTPVWDDHFKPASFSLVTAFAALHHIPGTALRRSIILKIRHLMEPGGRFILSNWQFLNSDKLRKRIQTWDAAGLSAADVDEGDYLLDWRSGGSGLRYVHHFSEQELESLAAECGFMVIDTFYSDGENSRLGLYQVWERDENKR